jgi:hypothetical protein
MTTDNVHNDSQVYWNKFVFHCQALVNTVTKLGFHRWCRTWRSEEVSNSLAGFCTMGLQLLTKTTQLCSILDHLSAALHELQEKNMVHTPDLWNLSPLHRHNNPRSQGKLLLPHSFVVQSVQRLSSQMDEQITWVRSPALTMAQFFLFTAIYKPIVTVAQRMSIAPKTAERQTDNTSVHCRGRSLISTAQNIFVAWSQA